VVSTTTPLLSLEEFLKQPETKPASEYINGQIYQKPMPQGKHSIVQTRLSAAVNQTGIASRTVHAFTELRCTFGNRSIVPDIAVFEWSYVPLNQNGEIENVFSLPPDWTIEILSPEQRPTRVIDNIVFCLNHGAQLGWLIDPEERIVLVFLPNQLPIALEDPAAQLPVLAALSGWQITIGELFGWLSFQ
jgi:Uma2 family endonuclease